MLGPVELASWNKTPEAIQLFLAPLGMDGMERLVLDFCSHFYTFGKSLLKLWSKRLQGSDRSFVTCVHIVNSSAGTASWGVFLTDLHLGQSAVSKRSWVNDLALCEGL